MLRHPAATPYLPAIRTLPVLEGAAKTCQGCDLYRNATQTVFGEGPHPVGLMLIGETPGDQEDRAGRPFVGPAGKLLDEAMREAGLDRSATYVTNAVKHFRWEPRGKRRLHKKPTYGQVEACRPWLLCEIEAVAPKLIVCLGSTAAQAMLGRAFRISQSRGEFVEDSDKRAILPTFHPSAILRAPTDDERRLARKQFVEDLTKAVKYLTG